MSTNRAYNFNPGPATLPLEVLEEFKDRFMNFGGLSLFEISHRSKEFEGILEDAKHLLTELMNIPKGYTVLFLQGGASLQFAMVPLNLMDKKAAYSITGYWSGKAASEAKTVGEVEAAFTSEGANFNRTPKPSEVRPSGSYLHITTNNTIHGTQYRQFPDTGAIPLVADASSDIASRVIEVSKFGLIYAGAQKNLGPAGLTIVIIRNDLIKKSFRTLPAILKYSTHAENNSLYNTPPVSAIYMMKLVLSWLKKKGGLPAIEKENTTKAGLIYDVLDKSGFYKTAAERESRSLMNITFTLPSEDATERFLSEAKKSGLIGLKGHRITGGIRASVYNAFPMEGARTLAQFMKKFEGQQ